MAFGLIPLVTAPRAHADMEDVIVQPVIDAIAQAVNVMDPGLASSFDPGLDAGSLAAPALAAAAAANASIPLQMFNTTSPLVDLSVSGGPNIPVLVDTGSLGLVVPWYDLGLQGLENLGSPIGSNIGGYGGNIDFFYLEFPETVNFGGGIVTSPTTVDIPLFAWPASLSNGSLSGLFNLDNWSFQAYEAQNGADGVLGIGPNAAGPGDSSVITALPGDLNEGVLVNETGGYLEFGPNPLPALGSVGGAPITNLDVSVNGGGIVPVSATIDSGGLYGTIPSSILIGGPPVGQPEPSGTVITVYESNGQEIYSYTTNATDLQGPTITSDNQMNTGYIPFKAYPVYISYSPSGVGTTVFDY